MGDTRRERKKAARRARKRHAMELDRAAKEKDWETVLSKSGVSPAKVTSSRSSFSGMSDYGYRERDIREERVERCVSYDSVPASEWLAAKAAYERLEKYMRHLRDFIEWEREHKRWGYGKPMPPSVENPNLLLKAEVYLVSRDGAKGAREIREAPASVREIVNVLVDKVAGAKPAEALAYFREKWPDIERFFDMYRKAACGEAAGYHKATRSTLDATLREVKARL
jgi:hypothetical protein